MSILEPLQATDAEDPLVDAVLGLHSGARRIHGVLERIAPEIEANEADDRTDPEPFIAFLLGLVATSAAIEHAIADLCPAVPSATPPRSTHGGGSFWR